MSVETLEPQRQGPSKYWGIRLVSIPGLMHPANSRTHWLKTCWLRYPHKINGDLKGSGHDDKTFNMSSGTLIYAEKCIWNFRNWTCICFIIIFLILLIIIGILKASPALKCGIVKESPALKCGILRESPALKYGILWGSPALLPSPAWKEPVTL